MEVFFTHRGGRGNYRGEENGMRVGGLVVNMMSEQQEKFGGGDKVGFEGIGLD